MLLLVEAEHLCEILKRRNIDVQGILTQFDEKSKRFPKYIAKIKGKIEYVFDDKDLSELTKDDEESQYTEILRPKSSQKFRPNCLSMNCSFRITNIIRIRRRF